MLLSGIRELLVAGGDDMKNFVAGDDMKNFVAFLAQQWRKQMGGLVPVTLVPFMTGFGMD